MSDTPLAVTRTSTRLLPDPDRVITKPFLPGEAVFPNGQSRVEMILERILGLEEAVVVSTLTSTERTFDGRHQSVSDVFESHFDLVAGHIEHPEDLSAERRRLIGAYFTHEYSIEAAALFNPSMVLTPVNRAGARPPALHHERARGRRGPRVVDRVPHRHHR